MIKEMARLLPDYSEVNQARCFLHIVNLVAKALVKQFDLPTASNRNVAGLDAKEQILYDIGDNEGKASIESAEDGSNQGAEDDTEELVDEWPFLTEEERADLNESSLL